MSWDLRQITGQITGNFRLDFTALTIFQIISDLFIQKMLTELVERMYVFVCLVFFLRLLSPENHIVSLILSVARPT